MQLVKCLFQKQVILLLFHLYLCLVNVFGELDKISQHHHKKRKREDDGTTVGPRGVRVSIPLVSYKEEEKEKEVEKDSIKSSNGNENIYLYFY